MGGYAIGFIIFFALVVIVYIEWKDIIIYIGWKDNKNLKKQIQAKYPPRVDWRRINGVNVVYVSVYKYIKKTRYGIGEGGYHRYQFVGKDDGKWKYVNENKWIYFLLCAVPLLFFIIPLIYEFGLIVFIYMIIPSLLWIALVYGCAELEALDARKALKEYALTHPHVETKKKSSKIQEEDKKHQYETIASIIKSFTRIFLFLLWFGILCLLSILLVMSGTVLCLMSIKESLPGAVFALGTSGVTIFVAGALLYGWICLRRPLMGDHSCNVPIDIAGNLKKYDPQYLLGRLNDKLSNVILLKNKQGQVRIYGIGNEYVLEIRSVKEEGERYYHLMQLDTDSVIPVLDDTPIVIENKWNERFPVRKQWLVDKETISAFLQKLYSCKDISAAMDVFSYGDTTEEIIKLMEADAYIVPEIPVDWPVGGLQSNMGQAWLRRKEVRLQRALKILERG